MISDNFNIVDGTITEIACAFNNSLGGLFTISILLSVALVIGFGVFSWNRRDPIGSFLYGFSSVTIVGFLLTLTSASNCDRLLSYEHFTILLVLTSLIWLVKKVID